MPVLLYPLVCPTQYRRVVLDKPVDALLREVCLEIAIIEIGTEDQKLDGA